MKTAKGKRPSSASVLLKVVKNEGFTTLYTGLSAGLLRQATYTTTRLGIYTWLFDTFSSPDGTPPNFFMKAALGMTAGATGAFVGTPAEVNTIIFIYKSLHFLKQEIVKMNEAKIGYILFIT